jgi:AAA15 family ATPase/GTPase
MSIVKSIRIQNFKSLEDVTIDLSQLTLLFGANSSGKSSFLKALQFLSKNLLHNFHSKERDSNNYKNDLKDYRNLIINNDIQTKLTFELDLQGKFFFPNYTFVEENMNKASKLNFFKFLKLVWQSSPYEEMYDFTQHDYSIKYELVFEYTDNHAMPTFFKMEDSISNSSITYKNVFMNSYDSEFLINGNSELSKVLAGNLELFELEKTFGFEWVLNKEFNEAYNEDGVLAFVSEKWESLTDSEKSKFFYDSIRFNYLCSSHIPFKLDNFFRVLHLGITRDLPRAFYPLTEGKFDNFEYYNLLNDLRESLSSETKIGSANDFFNTKVNIDETIKQSRINSKLEKKKSSLFYFQGHHVAADRNWIVENILLNTNRLLIELGFDSILSVSCQDDIGQVQLRGMSGFSCNLELASSGLIQILPILISCSKLVKRMIKGDFFNTQTQKHPEIDLFMEGLVYDIGGYKWRPFDLGPTFSTLLIEQPELHLHPKLQSDLAKIFADTVSIAAENASLLIETHSEHLIRKLQVLIAKGELAREKVGVWYFKKVNGVTNVEKMELDENGLFKKDWPDGFFDDSIELTMELFEAVRKRKN